MEYISGNIHPKLTEKMTFVILNDFIFCLLKDRYDRTDLLDDSNIIPLPLTKGSLITIRLFKPNSSPYQTELYVYVDSVYVDGEEKIIQSESIISKEFLERNHKNQVLFREASVDDLRDIKISKILK